MLGGLAAALIVATHLPWLGRSELVQRDAWVIFAGALVMCVVGVIDDLFELGAAAKLSGEVLAAGIVVLNGVKFYWIPLPDRIIALDNIASIALAVFVILFCTNAVNLMDGLDGLAAGVVAIGAASYFVYAYLLSYEQDLVRATTSSLITVALVGVCLGFLAPQCSQGAHVHGRLGCAPARVPAGHLGDQSHRATRSLPRERQRRFTALGLSATAVAVRRDGASVH
jgi:UDP-GlcNAc:undecaprenyl-phosphate GlcNAc-1-phosphate transferase